MQKFISRCIFAKHVLNLHCSPAICLTRKFHTVDKLLAKNVEWAKERTETDANYFKLLSSEQRPPFFYIGCADSRIPASEMLGLKEGDLFVHRNVANLVVNTDLNLQSCLEYAVNQLRVQHVIVMGHYDCGGVRAAMNNSSLGTMDHWVCNIRDVYRLHHEELAAIKDSEERHRRLVELNVVEQCLNIYKTRVVQKRRLETRDRSTFAFSQPQIHGLVFSLETGIIKRIPFHPIRDRVEKYKHVFDLYSATNTVDDM